MAHVINLARVAAALREKRLPVTTGLRLFERGVSLVVRRPLPPSGSIPLTEEEAEDLVARLQRAIADSKARGQP